MPLNPAFKLAWGQMEAHTVVTSKRVDQMNSYLLANFTYIATIPEQCEQSCANPTYDDLVE